MVALRLIFIAASLVFAGATSAEAQEREWLLDAAEEDVYLVFGVAETNDIGVSFWCKIGTQKVSVFTALPAGSAFTAETSQFSVSVNGKSQGLAPTVNAESTPPTIEAPLEPQAEILEALQAAERFTLTIGDHKTTYPLAGADVPGLLRLCAKQPEPAGQP